MPYASPNATYDGPHPYPIQQTRRYGLKRRPVELAPEVGLVRVELLPRLRGRPQEGLILIRERQAKPCKEIDRLGKEHDRSANHDCQPRVQRQPFEAGITCLGHWRFARLIRIHSTSRQRAYAGQLLSLVMPRR